MNPLSFHLYILVYGLVLCVPAGGATIYVDADAGGQDDGASWSDAYTSLRTAIDAASSGDELWVAEGTYGPIVLKSGVRVYGGFAGTESHKSESDPAVNKTYINGQDTARTITSRESDSSTLVRGFYIVSGSTEFPDIGAGVHLERSEAVFVDCVFTGNNSKTMGGAVGISRGSPTFVNCRFEDNEAAWGAGAVINDLYATSTFVNCLFHNNRAKEAGAIFVASGKSTFINCTFVDNHSSVGKGGAIFDTLGESVLRNCILWNNHSPVTGAAEIFNKHQARQPTDLVRCNVKGGWPGTGNLDADPVFVNAAQGDFRLRGDSPCRDAGNNAVLPADTADLSLDGNKTESLPRDLGMKGRVEGSAVDMGAFEWHAGE